MAGSTRHDFSAALAFDFLGESCDCRHAVIIGPAIWAVMRRASPRSERHLSAATGCPQQHLCDPREGVHVQQKRRCNEGPLAISVDVSLGTSPIRCGWALVLGSIAMGGRGRVQFAVGVGVVALLVAACGARAMRPRRRRRALHPPSRSPPTLPIRPLSRPNPRRVPALPTQSRRRQLCRRPSRWHPLLRIRPPRLRGAVPRPG